MGIIDRRSKLASLGTILWRRRFTVSILLFDIYRLSMQVKCGLLTDEDFLNAFGIRLMDLNDCHGERPKAVMTMVERLSRKAGLPGIPALGVLSDTGTVGNAIAIMAYGEHGLIAFTEGLFEILSMEEIEAVAGHEIGHLLHHHSEWRMRRGFVVGILRMAMLVGLKRWNVLVWLAFEVLSSKWLAWVHEEDEVVADRTGAELSKRGSMARALWKLMGSMPDAKRIWPDIRHRLFRLRPIHFRCRNDARV
jgi:Zn-dependent protease with chaperone function